ncbi:MAG: hypothetical protein Q8K72_08065, partial [Acidimicrobiales bacterium]|nr:hypothetical protein [Acidimicrobiales bacterium]
MAPDRRTPRLLLAVVLGGVLLALLSTPAGAQEPSGTEREVSVSVIDRQGTRDRDDDQPVAGAKISVTDAADEVVDEVETDAEGKGTITLPGEGQFTATLDLDSLPDEAGLPAEGREAVSIDPSRARVLNFIVGDRDRIVTTTADRIPQLIFNGLSFGLVIAICSVGLSLIFGTTGLVNFSHSEHVTWGAIVAWWINVDHGVNLWVAAVLAILIGAATGAL